MFNANQFNAAQLNANTEQAVSLQRPSAAVSGEVWADGKRGVIVAQTSWTGSDGRGYIEWDGFTFRFRVLRERVTPNPWQSYNDPYFTVNLGLLFHSRSNILLITNIKRLVRMLFSELTELAGREGFTERRLVICRHTQPLLPEIREL